MKLPASHPRGKGSPFRASKLCTPIVETTRSWVRRTNLSHWRPNKQSESTSNKPTIDQWNWSTKIQPCIVQGCDASEHWYNRKRKRKIRQHPATSNQNNIQKHNLNKTAPTQFMFNTKNSKQVKGCWETLREITFKLLLVAKLIKTNMAWINRNAAVWSNMRWNTQLFHLRTQKKRFKNQKRDREIETGYDFFFLGSFNKKITNLLISPLPSFSETLYYIYFSAKIILMHLYVCMIQRRLLSTLWYVETEPPSKPALWHIKMAAIRDVSWCSHQNLIFCYYSFLGWHLILLILFYIYGK